VLLQKRKRERKKTFLSKNIFLFFFEEIKYPFVVRPLLPFSAFDRRRDIQQNDTQHNDTQHNDTQLKDTRQKDTQHNDTQHNDTQHNDTQHNTRHK
jgi:hypothetical protein